MFVSALDALSVTHAIGIHAVGSPRSPRRSIKKESADAPNVKRSAIARYARSRAGKRAGAASRATGAAEVGAGLASSFTPKMTVATARTPGTIVAAKIARIDQPSPRASAKAKSGPATAPRLSIMWWYENAY